MLVPISKACDVLGAWAKTMRRWEKRGFINPYRTSGNHRRYDIDALVEFRESCVYDPLPEAKTGAAAVYARVSSPKQKEDLERQIDFLSERARKDGYRPKVYSDIGSGLNDTRPRMLKMLKDGLNCQFDRLYCTYLDRLARFGTKPLISGTWGIGYVVFQERGIKLHFCGRTEVIIWAGIFHEAEMQARVIPVLE